MPKSQVKIGVNGYGVIGKRVADAVLKQDDMKLVGVSDIASDYRVKLAVKKGIDVYCSIAERKEDMERAGIPVKGELQDLLKEIDVIIDCTPAGIGAKNKKLYDEYGVKSIFQGGEKHELTNLSFVAQCNYDENYEKNATRVVSCNTTGICRVIGALHREIGVDGSYVSIIRRATDPWESHKGGVINTIVPEKHIPSHQGPDAKTILRDLNIVTMAAKGPFNISHLHQAFIKLRRKTTKDEVLEIYRKEPRILLINISDGLEAPNSLMELMRDLDRPRSDMWEVALWEDLLSVRENEVYLCYQVHNECIVVPENIDAIRALTGLENNWRKSVEKTDRSLGLIKSWF